MDKNLLGEKHFSASFPTPERPQHKRIRRRVRRVVYRVQPGSIINVTPATQTNRPRRRVLSTRSWSHDIGLTVCYRQHRTRSRKRLLHGHDIAVHVTFEADTLDDNNQVIDTTALGGIEAWLHAVFDHKLLVAEDDPARPAMESLATLGLADVVIVPATGREAFANLVLDYVENWIWEQGLGSRVRVAMVEVREGEAARGQVVA